MAAHTKEQAKASLFGLRKLLEVAYDLGISSSWLHDLIVTAEAMTPVEVQSFGDVLHMGFGAGHPALGAEHVTSTPRGVCYFAFVNQLPQDH